MKFDDLLTHHLGELGRFQVIAVLILGFEEFFFSFQTIAPIFMAKEPEAYWCRQPSLDGPTYDNLTTAHLRHLTTPLAKSEPASGHGNDTLDYDRCHMYDTNVSALLEEYGTQMAGNVSKTADVVSCSEWVYKDHQVSATIVTEVWLLNIHL